MQKYWRVILVLVLALTVPSPAGAQTIGRKWCGGFKLDYGTTIADMGPLHRKQHQVSIEAVAAITTEENYKHPLAWIIWDEHAMPWIALRSSSPKALLDLWIFPKKPDFASPAVQVTPLLKKLPAPYVVTSCNVMESS